MSLSSASRVGARLLVVDDDPLVARVICMALEADGHRVVRADGGRSGVEALRGAQAAADPFDAVITDIAMPDLDGWAVAAQVKTLAPGTPVIVLSGGRVADAPPGASDHVDATIGKPPRLKDLRDALSACGIGPGAGGRRA